MISSLRTNAASPKLFFISFSTNTVYHKQKKAQPHGCGLSMLFLCQTSICACIKVIFPGLACRIKRIFNMMYTSVGEIYFDHVKPRGASSSPSFIR